MIAVNVITVSIRELKARTSEILRQLEKEGDLEVIVTRHGKPCAKLVSARRHLVRIAEKVPASERISLRNTWSHLPELTDADFEEAKRIWEPRPIE